MQFISVLGLISLLLLAWAMSYHPTKVRLRPIGLGIGLQLVLAMIILKTNYVSFMGMAIFGLILVVYVLHQRTEKLLGHIFHATTALVLGAVLYFLTEQGLPMGYFLTALLIALVGTTPFVALHKKIPFPALPHISLAKGRFRNESLALLIVCATVYLIAGEITGRTLFDVFSTKVKDFLALSDYGSSFLFGFQWFNGSNEYFPGFGAQFAFKILPTIIFFGGVMSVLYYLGLIQVVISAMSRFMRWSIGTSGAESLSCSANIFVGQTEAPLLVKPYLQEMTRSELLTVMVGGFATIAGGVLAGYISFGVDPGHLIAASVMSAPAAMVMAKIIYPELEHSKTAGDVDLPDIPVGGNVLEAATNGITDGFKLALNVGAMLLGFIALVAVLDVMLSFLDGLIDGNLLGGELREYKITGSSPVVSEYIGFFPGSLQTLFGTLLRPLAWLMGVPWEDAALVGNLLGVKLSLNEFVAFGSLGQYIAEGQIGTRAQIISTYAICGFANFGSVGIQLGGICALAPERRKDLSTLVVKAMFGGAFASWTTACIAGIFI